MEPDWDQMINTINGVNGDNARGIAFLLYNIAENLHIIGEELKKLNAKNNKNI